MTDEHGVRREFVATILRHADVEQLIGDNCRLLRVSRKRARRLNLDDRLGRYAVVWSDDNTQVVTVLPLRTGASGALSQDALKGATMDRRERDERRAAQMPETRKKLCE